MAQRRESDFRTKSVHIENVKDHLILNVEKAVMSRQSLRVLEQGICEVWENNAF